MIFTILAGLVVGASYGAAQPVIHDALGRLGLKLTTEMETVVVFALCLAAMALILRFLGVDAYPALLLVSGAAGVARKPLLARITGNA
ncbi:MAG: hypothetical protein AAF891_06500 [Pseudomonadota bacterium]